MHEDVPSIASVDRAEGADGATQLDVGGYVPLDDPGPGIASVDSVDRVEGAAGANQLGGGGDVPLEDPGPKSVKHGGEGAAGANQHEDVPLGDPGPHIASLDRAEGAAGATQ